MCDGQHYLLILIVIMSSRGNPAMCLFSLRLTQRMRLKHSKRSMLMSVSFDSDQYLLECGDDILATSTLSWHNVIFDNFPRPLSVSVVE